MTAAKDSALIVGRPGDDVEVIEAPVHRLGAVQPEGTLELATRMATALADVVDKQHLYSEIRSKKKDGSYELKKYPTVEAWMTIARMDNVVAREAEAPVRHDDGSYEAFTELVRLSDGMVVGRGSALCGTKGDFPWDGRPEPQRRSMAVTRATSRAFRQQYSWIMALAGYEPTPAEEMPGGKDVPDPKAAFSPPDVHEPGVLVGIIQVSKDNPGFLPTTTPEGFALEFKLRDQSGSGGIKVVAHSPIAEDLADLGKDVVVGARVSCWGRIKDESYTNKANRTITYQVLDLERITGPFGALPEANPEGVSPLRESEPVPGQVEAFDAKLSAELDAEEVAAG